MVTLGGLFRELCGKFSECGIENARFEAEQLLQHATGADRLSLVTSPETVVTEAQVQRVAQLAERRISGEPLQYLLGEWEFYGFPFKVGEGVLIPRQDTETLVELAQQHLTSDALCADLCAGSGCIGISLARLTGCRVHSYELSGKALGYLRENTSLNGVAERVTLINADVLSEQTAGGAPEYDAILSNPPYLTAEDMRQLQREVTFEPEMALFGGEDGLDFYRGILRLWSRRLKKGGLFAVEIGAAQAEAVSRIFAENGIPPRVVQDYCSNDRVVYGIKE